MRHAPARLLICVLLLLALSARGQQSGPAQSIPTFTARTELVTVPVVVLRRHGALAQLGQHGWLDEHVTGLTKDAFVVEEDGQVKPLASFEEIKAPGRAIRPGSVAAGAYSNRLVESGAISLAVLVLDLINTDYVYQDSTKKKLLEYLENQYRGDRPIMLVVMRPTGLRVLHDFTTDPKVLVDTIRRVKGNVEHDNRLDNQVQTEMSRDIAGQIDVTAEYRAIQEEFFGEPTDPAKRGEASYQSWIARDRLNATLDELQQLAHALGAVQGMKSLVWASGGIFLPNTMNTRDQRLIDKYIRTMRLLSDGGVAVYPIDTVMETRNPGYSATQSRYARPTPMGVDVQITQNFLDVAQRTGGDYCLLRKDPELCFRKAVEYDSQYYMLSYYTKSPETPRWRKIEVKVKGENLQVRARAGYFAGGLRSDPEERRKYDIAQAYVTPLEYRALPITVRWTGPAPIVDKAAPRESPGLAERPRKYPFRLSIGSDALTIDIADRNHIKLSIVAVALSREGKGLADITQQLDLHPGTPELDKLRNGGFAYANALEVPPHATRVRFIVRDDLSERIGTVSVPIAAP